MTAPHEPGLRVLVYHRAPDGRPEAVVEAYRRAALQLRGTSGLLAYELLSSPADRGRHLLVMDWTDRGAFTRWERAFRSAGHPSPLRPYQDRSRPGGHYEIYLAASRPRQDGSSTCQSPG
ncbi:antibiotic biosynthesis monooxygenase [Sphaerisporangium sp. TRM90804]|uniref:antibiotic biosynthesis monooxygenase family protein n=1 Tax=Sphaerisporangium sp. TRM90804 TaxID=3031113 RepID=UPI00244D3AEA|nr:antibiotic biosynthesis monooxygenase [Sphaerisporangium sp. TRM90804]MDH2427231.1 antibiotic biosynthesis monooxygenase [Sphaerisporangium sp. TRM90804]